MKKIKVLKAFFDRKEDKYVYPDKEPTIERDEARAEELIKAKVCAELEEAPAEVLEAAEPENQGSPVEEAPAEKPKGRGKTTK